jgi:hypothetical protein
MSVMTRDQALIALAAWQLARIGQRVVRPGPEQVKSFNRVVKGRQQHVRAFERRPPAPARSLSEVLAEEKDKAEWAREEAAAKAKAQESVGWDHPGGTGRPPDISPGGGWIPADKWAEGQLEWIKRGEAAWERQGEVALRETHPEAGLEDKPFLVKAHVGGFRAQLGDVPHWQRMSEPELRKWLVSRAPADLDHLQRALGNYLGGRPPDRDAAGGYLPPETWAAGQVEWIRRGEATWQRGGWMIAYEPDLDKPFGVLHAPSNQVKEMSEPELRAWLITQAPRPQPPVAEVPASRFGQGSAEVRRLTAQVAELQDAWQDPEQPAYGTQSNVAVRDLPDGTKMITKQIDRGSGEDEEDLDREELAFYVSQAIGAGAPAIVRLPDSAVGAKQIAGIAEEFVPGEVAAVVLGRGRGNWLTQLQAMWCKSWLTIGLLDKLTGNKDRNTGNFIVKEDGSLVPIDHGLVFEGGEAETGFASAEAVDAMRQMGDARVDELAVNLGQVRAEFARLGHLNWYVYTMRSLADLRTGPPQDQAAQAWQRALQGDEYARVWGEPFVVSERERRLWADAALQDMRHAQMGSMEWTAADGKKYSIDYDMNREWFLVHLPGGKTKQLADQDAVMLFLRMRAGGTVTSAGRQYSAVWVPGAVADGRGGWVVPSETHWPGGGPVLPGDR